MLAATAIFHGRAAGLRPDRAIVQLSAQRPLSKLANTDPTVFGTVDEVFEVEGMQIPAQRYVEADVGMTVRWLKLDDERCIVQSFRQRSDMRPVCCMLHVYSFP